MAKPGAKQSKSRRASSRYRHFRLSKRVHHHYEDDVPTLPYLIGKTWVTLRRHWRPFGLLMLIHLGLIILLVPAGATFNIEEVRQGFNELASEFGGNQLLTLSVLVGAVAGASSGALDQVSGLYSSLLFFTFSLAYIWGLRHIWVRKPFTAKLALYQGMYPMVPFILVLMLLMLQLTPLGGLIGLFSSLRSAGLIGTGVELVMIVFLMFLVLLLTGYFISGTLMALYAVSLPDMQPLPAIRAVRKLVEYRRWLIFRRILQLVVLLVIAGLLWLLIWIQLLPGLAFWAMSIGGVIALPVAHTYLYALYRKLL